MNHFTTILKKELLDLLRDKKTIIAGILLPILIYPALMLGMNKLAEKSFNVDEKNFVVEVEDNGSSSIRDMLKGQKNITLKDFEDSNKALKDGDLSLIIEVPDDFDKKIQDEKKADIKMTYDDKSNDSAMIYSMVKSMISEYGSKISEDRLKSKNIDVSILQPFNTESVNISDIKGEDDSFASGMMKGFSMMLPTLIIILLLAPTMGISVDLGAGEKERQTMEPLLSTAVSRISIVWAKIVALAIVGIITLFLTLGAIAISFKYLLEGSEMMFVNAQFILSAGITCLFLVLAIGALQIAISIYARSIKEANSYLSTIYVFTMILTYVPFAFDAKNISTKFFNIPIINTTCLLKELMAGIFRTDHLLMVLAWNVVYTIAAVLFARYMFSKEEVIFRS